MEDRIAYVKYTGTSYTYIWDVRTYYNREWGPLLQFFVLWGTSVMNSDIGSAEYMYSFLFWIIIIIIMLIICFSLNDWQKKG